LKEKTLKRIRVGLEKFGRQAFFFDRIHTPREGRDKYMVWPVDVALRTVIGQPSHGLVVPPFLVDLAYTHGDDRRSVDTAEPWPTQTGQQTQALCIPPFLVSLNHSDVDRARDLHGPMPTAMPQGNPALCIPPYLVDLRGQNAPKSLDDTLS